jgi:hypothetical protein
MLKIKIYDLTIVVNNTGRNFVVITYIDIVHRYLAITRNRNACADAISGPEKGKKQRPLAKQYREQ